MPAETPALSDSAPPRRGIITFLVACCNTAGDMPFDSLPITNTPAVAFSIV